MVIGFYRVCVIDQILTHSPADYVRRPLVPPDSPTLGLSHLQFEAMITAARLPANTNDFALVAMLGLLGLRIFEACGANIADLGEEHGHRVLKVRGKAAKSSSCRYRWRWPARSTAPLTTETTGRSCATPVTPGWTGTRAPVVAAELRIPRMYPHMLRHTFVTTMLDAGVSLRDVQIAARHADPRHHHPLRPRPQEPRPIPQLHPRRLHGLRNVASINTRSAGGSGYALRAECW
ncbi:site-specific integrase [Actinoplanes sp. NPDC026670]|uniref:tyrosine-type recombinase/integrase n=1 Tax=Actinoplanes sp. NPDC026670 TaxID=3154700 RepID=UPI0033D57DAB